MQASSDNGNYTTTAYQRHTCAIPARLQTLVPSKLGGQKNKLAPFGATWSAKWVGENKCQQASGSPSEALNIDMAWENSQAQDLQRRLEAANRRLLAEARRLTVL